MTAIGFNAHSEPRGALAVRKLGDTVPAPLSWKLRNWSRWGFIKGWIAVHLVNPIANFWGLMTAYGELAIKVRTWDNDIEREHFMKLLKSGQQEAAEEYAKSRTYWVDYGVVSYRVVTDAGVAYIVDDFDNGSGSADVSLFNFHGIGTTNTAEAVGDTALAAESTTNLNPNDTRATGTRTQPAANQYRSTGTLTADGTIAAVEHGLFTTSGTGSGVLFDRSVFSTVTLASGDSIQTQYTVTFSSGG